MGFNTAWQVGHFLGIVNGKDQIVRFFDDSQYTNLRHEKQISMWGKATGETANSITELLRARAINPIVTVEDAWLGNGSVGEFLGNGKDQLLKYHYAGDDDRGYIGVTMYDFSEGLYSHL
jgi:hypothetical protein